MLSRMGEVEETTQLFRELLGYANHLSLFSEVIDTETSAALGNFPQALTHIGLILTARNCYIDMVRT